MTGQKRWWLRKCYYCSKSLQRKNVKAKSSHLGGYLECVRSLDEVNKAVRCESLHLATTGSVEEEQSVEPKGGSEHAAAASE